MQNLYRQMWEFYEAVFVGNFRYWLNAVGRILKLCRELQSRFCNLRKSLACSSIHIFLTAGGADLRGNVPNDNGRLTSGKRDCSGSWFSFSVLANDTFHECFPIYI